MPRSAAQTDAALAGLSEADRRRLLEILEEERKKQPAAAPVSFLEKMKSLHERPSEISKAAPVDKRPLAKVLQLPLWANEERGAPNAWLRSSLFRVVEKGAREYHEKLELHPWGTTRIQYTGKTLDQADLDVALQCVHMAAQGTPGRPVAFTDRGMLKALGRSYGSGMLRWFDESMERLRWCGFTITDERGCIHTENLLTMYVRDPKAGERYFILNPVVAQFFVDDEYTLLQWRSRLAMKGQLAKWLHAFLCTSRSTANGVSLAKLRGLAGISPTRAARLFRFDLEKALEQLLKLDDEHLGLVKASIVEGAEGPKLVWTRRPNRRLALHQGRRG